MAFRKVARLQDIPWDRGLCITVDGIEIAIYRVAGELHAMDNLCPHAGYPLGEGLLEGSVIVCPGHGWEFDVCTGRAPGEVDEEPLARYPVRLEADEVWVDVATPL